MRPSSGRRRRKKASSSPLYRELNRSKASRSPLANRERRSSSEGRVICTLLVLSHDEAKCDEAGEDSSGLELSPHPNPLPEGEGVVPVPPCRDESVVCIRAR